MGCCIPVQNGEDDEFRNVFKVLFLGPGGCGKSTMFKQLKKLNGEGFAWKDRLEAKQGITVFIVETMQSLLKEEAGLNLDEVLSEEAQVAAKNILALESSMNTSSQKPPVVMTDEIANDLQLLWAQQPIKNIFETTAKLQLNGSCAHFFDSLDRIKQENYEPTDKDILLQRRPTSGLIEQTIKSNLEDAHFLLVDVGGQKNERRKWMHHFEVVAAMVFVVSLAAYDEPLYEDAQIHSLHDSLELFEKTVNNRVFERALIYVVFNKVDIYRQKIAKRSLRKCFENHPVDYDEQKLYHECKTDEEKYEKNLQFLQKLYLDKAVKHQIKDTFVTCAYDEHNIQTVFDEINASILKENKKIGLAKANAHTANSSHSAMDSNSSNNGNTNTNTKPATEQKENKDDI